MTENELIQQYDPLVGKIWGKYIYKTKEALFWQEDIFQEGRIGLLCAIRAFDKYKPNADFLPFACMCIRRKMTWAIKRKYNNRYGIYDPKKCISLYKPIVGDDITFQDVLTNGRDASDHILYEDDLNFVKDVLNVMDSKTQLIMPLILEGINPIEIQDTLGIERHVVSAYVSKFKSVIRDLYPHRNDSNFPHREEFNTYEEYLLKLGKYKRNRKKIVA